MENVNRIRRYLLPFAIFSHGNSCNKSILEWKHHVRRYILSLAIFFPLGIVVGYIFSMESLVINRIRRQLLLVGYIFPKESRVINSVRRQMLLSAIFSNENSCNISY